MNSAYGASGASLAGSHGKVILNECRLQHVDMFYSIPISELWNSLDEFFEANLDLQYKK